MTLRAPRRLAALVAAPALIASGVAFAAPGADAAATSEPTYKGSALALSVKVGLTGSSILDEVLPALVTYPPALSPRPSRDSHPTPFASCFGTSRR